MDRSAAAVGPEKTYVFYNAQDSDGNRILRSLTYDNNGDTSSGNFKVNNVTIQASDGPMAACNIDTGIRLYVINNRTIVEYGKDGTGPWKKEGFTTIKLAQKSNLNALGVEYKGQKYKGEDIIIRIFYVEEDSNDQVTMNTYTRPSGWRPERLQP